MNEIRQHCAQLLDEHGAGSATFHIAYGWLMGCPPFVATLEAMEKDHVTVFELAEALKPDATGEATERALAVLRDAMAKYQLSGA